MSTKIRALILAAGQGTRLRPLTNDRPKCLVELAEKPLLQRQVDVLRQTGIDDIHVITGYRGDMIEALGYSTVHNPEFESTNMVASLFCAEHLMTTDSDLLIVYGDIVFEPRVIDALLGSEAQLSTTIDTGWRAFWETRMDNPLDDVETLKLDAQDRIVEIGKKPTSLDDVQGQYMGLIKVRQSKVEDFVGAWQSLSADAHYDGRDKNNMFMTSFLTTLIEADWSLCAVFVEHGWLEVDTVEDLSIYHRMVEDGQLDKFYTLG